jgi:hypothetical protein
MIPPGQRRPVKGSATFWAALAACAAVVFWIAGGTANLEVPRQRDAWHHYEYLAEGFLSGHTYVSVTPDPGLLKLKDPYDPKVNARYRLWDASLYKGRFYLYFGPVPALFMLPWRIATGQEPSQRLVVASFAAAGLAGLALLIWELRRRFFPETPPVVLGAILVVAFHASWLPVILRRSEVWELAIVAAAAFLWWSLYFLWKFHESNGKARWAVATGVSRAHQNGIRANILFEAAVIALLLFVPVAGNAARGAPGRGAAVIAAMIAFAGGCALLLYNHERFGSWLEMGTGYQLPGADYRGINYFKLRYIPFNARTYLLSLPRFGPYFPFVHPFWSADLPEGYLHVEDIYGVLFMMPIHLAGLYACAWAWANRSAAGAGAAVVTLVAAACASVLSGLVFFIMGGACSRYITEILAGWTVVTSIGIMSVFGAPGGLRPGRVVRVLACAAACWSVACVWLASAEYEGYMARANPWAYAVAAHAMDYPSQWWASAKGIQFGPLDIAVRFPESRGASQTVLVATGRPLWMNRLVADRVDGDHVQLILLENDRTILVTPAVPVKGGLLRIRLDAPWLYPPAAHPYWDGLEPGRARELQNLFAVRWDSGGAAAHSRCLVDPESLEPLVNLRSPDEPDSPYVESVSPVAPGP